MPSLRQLVEEMEGIYPARDMPLGEIHHSLAATCRRR